MKLVLAFLWFIPGIVLLIRDFLAEKPTTLSVLGKQVPLAYLFLAFGVINAVRWYSGHVARSTQQKWEAMRRRPRPRVEGQDDAGNSDFQFQDLPPGK